MSNTEASPDQLVYTSTITSDVGITDRCLRKWVATNKFPAPDSNLNGRLVWKLSTYSAWKADVLAGKYHQRRRPGVTPLPPKAA